MGNDVAVGIGGMNGDLELNVMIPMMVRNVIESENLLANVSRVFVDKCIAGIEETGAGTHYVERSLMQVTALVPELGYERSAELAKQAHKTGQTLREVALEAGVSEETLDRVLDYKAMTEGGVL
jgi:fumarate hydratase class II